MAVEKSVSRKKSSAHVTSAHAVSSGLRNPDEKDPIMKTPRLNAWTAAPEITQAFLAYSNAVAESGLEKPLLELVKIRSSQINGCANCINMHATEAREKGETEQRIYLLPAWREAPCYTDRERAALGWTEALTRLCEGHAHESAYQALKVQFSKEEQIKLTMMINVINGWNRLAVAFHLFEPSLGWKA
jgi:AhpD family alkylhydroperoxidase